MAAQSLKIYLAGPEVFRKDAIEVGRELVALCAEFGFTGLYPLDNEVPAHLGRLEKAVWIREANLARIREADLVMANLNFFRGACVDEGTALEVGFARALGRPVYGYLSGEGDILARMKAQVPQFVGEDGYDSNGDMIEDFGLPVNLMFPHETIVVGTARDCLSRIATDAGMPMP